jgi:hypothetical protein
LFVGRRVADTWEDVGDVLGGFDAVGDAGADKRVESGEVPACAWMSEEEIVVSGKGDDSETGLRSVVVYGNAWIGEEELEPSALVERISERFSERSLWKELGLLRLGPPKELVDERLAACGAHGEMGR